VHVHLDEDKGTLLRISQGDVKPHRYEL